MRTTGADRLIASGPYCIISQPASANSDRRTSFLCYATTLPREPGEVQKAFNIDAEGSFTISVKNPAGGDPPRAGLKEKAEFPDECKLISSSSDGQRLITPCCSSTKQDRHLAMACD